MNTSNPKTFFTTNSHVWTSENFQHVILAEYSGLSTVYNSGVRHLDLKDIGNTSFDSVVYTDTNVLLETLVALIEKQINGEEGDMLNDSSANYFFLKAHDGNFYSVLVRFEPAQKLWRCGAYLQENLKMPNVRLFLVK